MGDSNKGVDHASTSPESLLHQIMIIIGLQFLQ